MDELSLPSLATAAESADAVDLFEATAPPPRREAIERRRLLDQLGSARTPCIAVIAPAGFGKTTLLAQWAQGDGREQAWITLDERHNDAVLLIGQIAASLDMSEPLGDEVFAPLGGPSPDVARVVVPRLCRALSRRREPVALILDDVQAISDPRALACVAGLAEGFPDGSRLLIASRSEPEIGIGRLRAHGRLGEIPTSSMAMTRGEAARAFGAVGRDLPGELVLRLVELTEGWPAALLLAAGAMQGEEDPARVLDSFAGDERVIADYIRDEFLSGLAPEDLDFLTKASLFDRLSGEFCDPVLQRDGSAEALRRMSRSNLLLSPLDSKDSEFRMHALLGEMLRGELHRLGAKVESGLHRRASDWYRAHGDIDRSVEHAIHSGDVELAGERIWAVAVDAVTTGRRFTLLGWIGSFSDAQVEAVPTLCMTLALTSLAAGDADLVRRWTSTAVGGLRGLDDPDRSLVATAEILRLSSTSKDLAAVAAGFESLFEAFPEGSPWRSYSRFTEGVIRHLLGDRERAFGLLGEGARLAASRAPSVQTLCIAQLALIALDEGRNSDADDLAAEAISRIELVGLERDTASSMVFGVAALVRSRRGDASSGRRMLSSAEALIDSNPSVNDWFTAQALITMARASVALGDRAGARSRLSEAGPLCEGVPEAGVLHAWMATEWEALDDNAASRDGWLLTPAELRLLRLLPTHLSFPEIAANLVISTNTVKTQARSIYRKLGASSRSGAVEISRQAGLLDGGKS